MTYIGAANYLVKMHTPRAGFTFSNSGSNWPVLLLYAIAAENLLKAIRIAQRDEAVVVKGKLAQYYTTHDLVQYAADARLGLGKRDRSLLQRLQHVLEAGKYPVAKGPRQSDRAWRFDYSEDVQHVWQLLQTLDAALRRTGVRCLPEFEVGKLHSPRVSRRRRTSGCS